VTGVQTCALPICFTWPLLIVLAVLITIVLSVSV